MTCSVAALFGVATAPPAAAAACNAPLSTSAGGAFSFGRNVAGQLGDGTLTSQSAPVVVQDLGPGAGVLEVAAAGHSLARTADGAVYAFGKNESGQLGNNTIIPAEFPVPVTNLGPGSNVIDVAAGTNFSLALKSDGTVLAWGGNANGQLGTNNTTASLVPVQVQGLGAGSGVTAVSAGLFHSLALKSDGTVLAWGTNSNGQIGDNTAIPRLVPTAVTGALSTNITAISAGASHNLALRGDGSVVAWGFNGSSRLGDNTTTDRLQPVQVTGLTAANPSTAISAGGTHSLALRNTGLVMGWGLNTDGQVGDGTVVLKATPVAAIGLAASGVTGISAGATHNVARKSDGSAISWGNSPDGRLGDGQAATDRTQAVLVSTAGAGTNVVEEAAGEEHSLIVRKTPSVAACAGTNQSTAISTSYPTVFQAAVRNIDSIFQPGVTVTFTAPATGPSGTFAGGAVTAQAITNGAGVATAPAFTANTVAGSFAVTVSAAGFSAGPAIRLTNNAGPPASIAPFEGTPQAVAANAPFPVFFKALVKDASNNPVAGAVVTFTGPTSGAGGTFTGGGTTVTATTDSDGLATAPRYTANATAGSYLVRATVGSLTPANFALTNTAAVVPPPARTGRGYVLAAADGGVFAFGDARFVGSAGATRLNKPIVGAANTPTNRGYWLVASDGGIFAFGDAAFLGSTGAITLNKPIVGMASTPSGKGYWLVASDGGIFAFGDAAFQGSTGATVLNRPIVGMTSTPSGNGYWLVASDGGIFAFGDAAFFGSTGATTLNRPIVGMASTPSGKGYVLVASDGGIFAYGDASFHGSTGATRLTQPIVGGAATPTGKGYTLVASDGGIFAFGDARFFGSTGATRLNSPIVAMAAT